MKEKIMRVQEDIGAKMVIDANKDKVFNLETNNENITKNFNTKESFSF